MKVAYRLEALQDLGRHRAYILDRNPNAARRIADPHGDLFTFIKFLD